MLEHYKRTFWGMQIVIAFVTGGVLVWSRLWILAALFFVTMQLGSVLGAMWAKRLQNKLRRAGAYPPR